MTFLKVLSFYLPKFFLISGNFLKGGISGRNNANIFVVNIGVVSSYWEWETHYASGFTNQPIKFKVVTKSAVRKSISMPPEFPRTLFKFAFRWPASTTLLSGELWIDAVKSHGQKYPPCNACYLGVDMSSVESQKGVSAVKRCSFPLRTRWVLSL